MYEYTMKISRMTVDKLGVRLYDRVSAVIAELVSNSYDADATNVIVKAPMGVYLATKQQGQLQDRGYSIEVIDNGIGMTPEEVNNFYLRVGKERRKDPDRGNLSKKFSRKVMGRKGVGKLAPFGICKTIEIISSGGELIDGVDENGNPAKGYLTAHLVLNYEGIITEDDADYNPDNGSLDGIVRSETGTFVKLTNFEQRKVPDIIDFERQLSQRFGLTTANWEINIFDQLKTEGDPDFTREVGKFSVTTMPETEIRFVKVSDDRFESRDSEGRTLNDITAGIYYEDIFYPITGWVGYAEKPYKDDLMAGVRIYCRGKIAAQTSIFGRKAGFTGEHSIRSYLVGEIHADFLDDFDEDLIQTDRRDILWSHDIGQALEEWGQALVLKIGKLSRDPMKKKVLELFKEASNYEERIDNAFPLPGQEAIRNKAKEIVKMFGQTIREGEVNDPEHVENLLQLGLMFAPHITLDDKLREAAAEERTSLGVIAELLKTARVAELSSFGRIADDRIKVIDRVEALKDDEGTLEAAFQNLIEQAPWLVNPQWAPITSNVGFSTVRREFEKFYEERTGTPISLNNVSDTSKRMDFVFSQQDGKLQIIEIKRPKHAFEDIEFTRFMTYKRLMDEFLDHPSHSVFKEEFRSFHMTLVCDELKLGYEMRTLFDLMIEKGILTYYDWATFLLNTKKMHQEFIAEAERQKEYASRE